jgi:hypothetical protein
MLLNGFLDIFLLHNVSRISEHWPNHWTESRIVLLLSIVKLSCNNYANDCAITFVLNLLPL